MRNKSKDDVRRLGIDSKTYHYWDRVSFNEAGRPVAICGAELYPRSLKFIDRENFKGQGCRECGTRGYPSKIDSSISKTWKPWTNKADEYLRRFHSVLTFEEMSEVVHHTPKAIQTRVSILGLSHRR